MNVLKQKVLKDQSVLNCKEVSRIVASDELDGLGALKRIRVRFHLLICRGCRRYAEQIRIIGAAARERVRSLVVDKGALARLEKSILGGAFGAERDEN